MKFRFFLILLLSLSAVGLTLTLSFSYFLNLERLNLIDLQLRESAVTLVNSELADIKKINFEEAEELISEELGSSRVGKFFIIRNEKGEIVFKSGSASLMDVNPPNTPQSYTYKAKNKTIRILNLNLPKRPDRTLQIGALIDPTLFDWNFIVKKLSTYLIIILIPILIFSFVLTNYLLNPLRLIAKHLQIATNDLQNLKPVPILPKPLLKYTQKTLLNSDEFSTMVESIGNLLERININYKMTKPWSYQLAHEIKTPLSILSFDVETLSDENLVDKSIAISMNEQIERISKTVSQFLEWASVENTQQKENLFAIRMANSIEDQIKNLDRLYPGRIELHTIEDYIVISNPQHLQQLTLNLLTNALNYSPEKSKVVIELFDNTLKITDEGKGIPKEVIDRLGQPFNCGPYNQNLKHKRTGLGLAWINTITKLYGWNLEIHNESTGCVILVKFTKNLIT